jgi:CRISPR-associated endonuclease/helicase Cas3
MIPEDKITQLTLLNGEKHLLPWQRQKLNKEQWRKLSATLMRQVVSLRPQDAPLKLPMQLLEKIGLQHCFYLENPTQDEAALRVALMDESGILKGIHCEPVHGKYALSYRNDLGYRVIKN